ncbi:MAG: glucosamine-6-phosphate deaminase [Clostridia bacterium]
MKIIKVKNYDEMSKIAAKIICSQVVINPKSVLGLATGSSPIGTYENIINEYKAGCLDFSEIKTVNLDEYHGLGGDNEQSYRYFMDKHLFDLVNIKKENTNVPNGLAENIDEECLRYEAFIDSLGGIDLQLLGIGHNGHIGFNEPDDHFPNIVHSANLASGTIEANSRMFEKIEDVPTVALSMGIGTIMRAKKILLIAGKDKTQAVMNAINGKVTPSVPASILQLHPDVTIITCEE